MKQVKLLVWGDLQAHPWQVGERPDRWKDCLKTMRLIAATAAEHHVDATVFLGDLFENKRTWRSDIATSVIAAMSDLFDTAPQHFLLAGNHDWHRGVCSLQPFAADSRVQVITTDPVTVPLPQCAHELYFVPYGAAPQEDMDYTLAFTHAMVAGARLSRKMTCTVTGLPSAFLNRTGRRVAILNGHIHTPQNIQRSNGVLITCVGAPMQHSWSDLDDAKQRGCLILTLENGKAEFTRVNFNELPRFSRETNKERPQDFVLPEICDRALNKETVVHKNEEAIGVLDDLDSVLDNYVDTVSPGNADGPALKALGLELFHGAPK